MPGAIIDPDWFLHVIPDWFRYPFLAFLRSSRACSGIQLLSLSSQKWIPAYERAGKTVSKRTGKTVKLVDSGLLACRKDSK